MPHATNADDGVRIYYEVEGAGPPLVLHVGFMGRLQDWRRVGLVDELRDEYQLILMDPRGQGKSDKPHDVEAYAIHRFVGDVVTVLNAIDISQAHFLGYSMGAQIGFAAGLLAPDRFLSFILGGSHPYLRKQFSILGGSMREDAVVLSKGMSVFVDKMEEEFGSFPPEVRDQWLENDGTALAANTLATEQFPDITEQLTEISRPTLIYCGTEDPSFTLAQEASEIIPGAKFVPLEGTSHLQVFRQIDLIIPHIRQFLSQIRSPN